MNASTIKDYFVKRCTYSKVILLTAIFGFALSMTLNASVNYSFASGDSNLMGGSDNDNDDDDGNDRDDFAGCSDKKLNKGYVNLCVSKNNKVDKICVKQKKADKLLSDNDDDDDGHKHKNYYIPVTFYQDLDGDQYGSSISVADCLQPEGFVEQTGDCNDDPNLDQNAVNVNPGAVEIACDGIDNNCSGNDEIDQQRYIIDADGDGFNGTLGYACEGATEPEDCDDTVGSGFAINPDAEEICDDNIDNNCNGDIDGDDSDCEVAAVGCPCLELFNSEIGLSPFDAFNTFGGRPGRDLTYACDYFADGPSFTWEGVGNFNSAVNSTNGNVVRTRSFLDIDGVTPRFFCIVVFADFTPTYQTLIPFNNIEINQTQYSDCLSGIRTLAVDLGYPLLPSSKCDNR